jgi:hypothetical protein
MRATELATAPAAFVWRSAPALPLRLRVADVSAGFTVDGRGTVTRSLSRGRAVAGMSARRLGVQAIRSGVADEAVDRLLTAGVVDRVTTVVVNHPATEHMVDSVLDDPALDRLVSRVLDSRLIDELTARVLDSDEMRMVLEHVTRSPELRAALAQQTAGLAGDMAVGVRSRTVVADEAAERFARGLLRRRNRPQTQ